MEDLRPLNLDDDFRRHTQGIGHDRQAGTDPQRRWHEASIHDEDARVLIHPAIRVEDGVFGAVSEAKRSALMGHVLVGAIPPRGGAIHMPDRLRIRTIWGVMCFRRARS